MKKCLNDQTIRNKPFTHSSKTDNSLKNTSSFQLRRSQSHFNSRGAQNDQFENVKQHHSKDRRPDSSPPQFKYGAFSSQLNYVDPYPGKSLSAGNVFFLCI